MGVILITVLMLSVFSELKTSHGSYPTYRAAVLEYNPVDQVPLNNVAQYAKYMKEAKQKGAEIIVFPEGGLKISKETDLSPVPAPYEKIAPCDPQKYKGTEIMVKLSCASKDNGIYSVVNLPEKRDCKGEQGCPKRGYFIYNTNVAFDRSGVVVARYAKFNLFDENLTNRTAEPELSFFDTDFGVRFGTFICFDILFPTPALQLIDQFGISNFAFSTMWFSELPFLTAVQTQAAWAQANNVNLLASGHNFPKIGSTGSGIYNGKFGSLVSSMPEKNTTKLLVADVPLNNNRMPHTVNQNEVIEDEPSLQLPQVQLPYDLDNAEEQYSQMTLLSDQMEKFQSKVIKTGEIFNSVICSHSGFCCNFWVNVVKKKENVGPYHFRAVAFNGVRKFGKGFAGGVQTCGVVLCTGPNIMNCAQRGVNITKMFEFKEIKIKGEFQSKNSFQMISTLTDGNELRPLPVNKYTYNIKQSGGNRKIELELVWPVDNLQTFAIWGRNFARDGEEPSPTISKASFAFSFPIMFIVSLLLVIFSH